MSSVQKSILHGEQLVQEGRLDEALAFFEAAVEADPNNADALNNLGVVAVQLQRESRGLEAFLRAFCLSPDSSVVQENLAMLLDDPQLKNEAGACLSRLAADEHFQPETRHFAEALRIELSNADAPHGSEADDEAGRTFRGAGKKRLLFLEQKGLSTGGFLDEILNGVGDTYEADHVLTTDLNAAARAVQDADVVWLEWAGPLTAMATQRIPQLRQKPVVCRIHGFEVFTDHPGEVDWSVVDRLAFVASHKQMIFNERWPRANVQQTVIRNGVNTDHFTVAPGKRNTKKLLLLGHLNYRKGIPMLLQFYHELLKRDDGFHLFIRGSWQDGRYQLAARTMIRELGLQSHITFVDQWIDDLNAWLADKSHILSFSLEESFHYSIGNGMAAGLKPVVHAWTESRDIWPDEFIFRHLDEFLAQMLTDDYEPERYRKLLSERNLLASHQVAQFKTLLQEVERSYASRPRSAVA